jgi:hypothetical protein
VIGLHTHAFQGVTVYVDGHLHLFSGVTSASPNVPGHTHTVSGVTTTNSGHWHNFSMQTQGPTYVDSGGYKHYHYYKGNTNVAASHTHGMESTTFVLGE